MTPEHILILAGAALIVTFALVLWGAWLSTRTEHTTRTTRMPPPIPKRDIDPRWGRQAGDPEEGEDSLERDRRLR